MAKAEEPINEKIVGSISPVAHSPDYNIFSLIFTDSRILGVAYSDYGATGGYMDGGIETFAAMKGWNQVKKANAGKPITKTEEAPLTSDLIKKASFKLPYEKIKSVSIKKVWASSDQMLGLKSGLFSSEKLFFDGMALEEVKQFISKTPLATKYST